jgi:hypothetical protein
MPSTCSKAAANILGCSEKQLRDFVNHPENFERLQTELEGKKVRTTYKDRNGFRKTFFIDGITPDGADIIMAYRFLPSPFNINVAAHFYAKHEIRLKHPYSPCVVEKIKRGLAQTLNYYPMELIELIEDEEPKWLGNMFREIGQNPSPTGTKSTDKLDEDSELAEH